MAITSFRGEHRFLSNFHPSIITLDDGDYHNVEAAFQASKTDALEEREHMRSLTNPVAAKRYGRKVQLRPHWNEVKYGIMEELLRQKFTRYPDLGEKLLATGDEELIETIRGKLTWGNSLGKALMKVRDELRRGDIP
jgi:ribA/ribD-fused uncharacterized protein